MSDVQSAQVVAFSVTGTAQIKPASGRLLVASNNTAAAVTFYDAATTGAAGAGNLLATLPAATGVYPIDMPFYAGLVIIAGAGNASVGYV